MSNNFHKTSLLKNSWIGNFWHQEKDFKKKNWRDVAVPESVQSCFELSIHFPVFFSRELFLAPVHGWFALQTNVWKVQNTTGRFLAQLHPSNFFLKILFLVLKVSNSWIFQKRCFMKVIWHMISIQTLLSQACLPTRQNGVEYRDKAYYSTTFIGNYHKILLEDARTWQQLLQSEVACRQILHLKEEC